MRTELPIVCTFSPGDQPARTAAIRELGRAVDAVETVADDDRSCPHGVASSPELLWPGS
jgi:ribosomal protein S11